MRAEGREWEINAKALRGKGAKWEINAKALRGKGAKWEINAKAQKGKGAEGDLTQGHRDTVVCRVRHRIPVPLCESLERISDQEACRPPAVRAPAALLEGASKSCQGEAEPG